MDMILMVLKSALILACTLLVSGCAGTKWEKAGASPDEFEATKASCLSRGYARVPPMMVPIQVGGGYTTPVTTNCYGSGYGASCTSSGGQYIQPVIIPVDENSRARAQDVRSCFFENGWTPVKT
nr:hypothetical protein [uncultured Lichenicoccus sp.]